MAKLSVNQAQDAMGFRSAVTGAHSHYMLSQLSNAQWARRQGRPEREGRRLPLVERILGGGAGTGGAGSGGQDAPA
jgi:hypothetical protein